MSNNNQEQNETQWSGAHCVGVNSIGASDLFKNISDRTRMRQVANEAIDKIPKRYYKLALDIIEQEANAHASKKMTRMVGTDGMDYGNILYDARKELESNGFDVKVRNYILFKTITVRWD